MGFWSGLGKALLNVGTGGIAGAVGAGLGAISQGSAQNRGTKLGAQMDLERLLMDRDQQYFNNTVTREQAGQASASDAWRKLLAAQHVLSPGARPNVTPYGVAPRQATGAELTGADALTQEVLARLTGGNPIAAPTMRPIQVDPKLMNAGWLEKLTGYASAPLLFGSLYSRPSSAGRGGDINV